MSKPAEAAAGRGAESKDPRAGPPPRGLAARVGRELARRPVLAREFHDPVRGYRGFLVIDSLCGGRSGGGVRIRPGLCLDELRNAARVMTLKQRFAGVPTGGAKSGVEGDEDLPREEKLRRVRWLAREMAPWLEAGVLGVGPDMGTDPELIGAVLAEHGFLAGRRRFPARFRGSGYYTALTAVEAAEEAVLAAGGPGAPGRGTSPLRGLRVAVEGFGAVGSNAARLAAERGARVVAISTRAGALHRPEGLEVEALLRARDPLAGDPAAERIPRETLLGLPVDVLLPCGPGDTLHLGNAASVRARVISPGANTPVDLDVARTLREGGALLVPSFVANCGGITAATLRVAEVSDRSIEVLLRKLYPRRVAGLLRDAEAAGVTPLEIALATLPPFPGEAEPFGRARGGEPGEVPASFDADPPGAGGDPLRARDAAAAGATDPLPPTGEGVAPLPPAGAPLRSAPWLRLRRLFRSRAVPAPILALPTWLYFAWRLGRRQSLR